MRIKQKSENFDFVNINVLLVIDAIVRYILLRSKELLGETHPDTLASMNNLAEPYRRQGKYEKAEPLYVDCLARSKDALGETHPDTLASINNLAGLYRSQGKYEKAEPLYVDSLPRSKAVLGESHPNTLTSMNNLALLYENQAEIREL